jgi:hypothetical protein
MTNPQGTRINAITLPPLIKIYLNTHEAMALEQYAMAIKPTLYRSLWIYILIVAQHQPDSPRLGADFGQSAISGFIRSYAILRQLYS